jgi:hypothetical protein
VVLAGLVVAPAQAATITFNPSGTGTGAGALTGVSGFNYATSSTLVSGTPTVGSTIEVFYESVISGTMGNVAPVGPNFNLNNSGNQFTVIAGFQEKVTGINLIPGGGPGGTDAAIVNFSLASPPTQMTGTTSPNFFFIFANAPGSANPSTGNGAGFGSGTQVLSGHLVSTNFAGSFSEAGTITNGVFTPQTVPFNQSGLPTANTTPLSAVGGGGTQLTVAVNSVNAGFFPGTVEALTFSTTNSLPFASVAPLTGFFSGPGGTPDINYPANFNTGPVNGAPSGTALNFQSIATNGFIIPEPASIIPALTALTLIPSVFYLRRRFSRNTSS